MGHKTSNDTLSLHLPAPCSTTSSPSSTNRSRLRTLDLLIRPPQPTYANPRIRRRILSSLKHPIRPLHTHPSVPNGLHALLRRQTRPLRVDPLSLRLRLRSRRAIIALQKQPHIDRRISTARHKETIRHRRASSLFYRPASSALGANVRRSG